MKLQWVHDHEKTQLNLITDKFTKCVGYIDHEKSMTYVCLGSLPGRALAGDWAVPWAVPFSEENIRLPQQVLMSGLRERWPVDHPVPDFAPDIYPPHEPETISLRTYSELNAPVRYRVLLQLHDLFESIDSHVSYPTWDDTDTRFVLETMLKDLADQESAR